MQLPLFWSAADRDDWEKQEMRILFSQPFLSRSAVRGVEKLPKSPDNIDQVGRSARFDEIGLGT